MNKKIFYVAGKSGGHIIPALTESRKEHERGAVVYIITTHGDLDKLIMHTQSWMSGWHTISIDNLPNRWYKYPFFAVNVIYNCAKMFWLLARAKPQLIRAFGGYPSVIVCVAAWLLRIPFELVELNVIPGKATVFLAPYARHIDICFAATASYLKQKTTAYAYPVRFAPASTYSKNYAQFGLDATKKTILVLGGSQGSVSINKAFCQSVPLLSADVQIIHQTGHADYQSMRKFYATHNRTAYVCSFYEKPEELYILADVVLARAGAGTLFELIHFNKKSLIIPLPAQITDHQQENARAVAQSYPHNFVVQEQVQMLQDPTILAQVLTTLLSVQNSEL